VGPDGKPCIARISDGSGLNNLPAGVFGVALAPESIAEDVNQDEVEARKALGSRPGSPHQNALRKRWAPMGKGTPCNGAVDRRRRHG
jgi:hypothetical protein